MKYRVLVVTVLLLGLFTHISAQNRSAKETLQGLKDIGLVVKYANADGLDEVEQPTVLDALRERAKGRLWDAKIPLLAETDEAALVGQPRLVFLVTVNKNVQTAPAVFVECQLYERVQLRRDGGKEMELASWATPGGYGYPTVTKKMILDVFDGQVNEFINYYREANPNPPQVERAEASVPVSVKDDANVLDGLSGTSVFVWVRPEHGVDPKRYTDLQKAFQQEAEARLLKAGIRLLKYADESERAGNPVLYLAVRLNSPSVQTQAPPISVDSKLWQHVRPLRDLKIDALAVTWENEATAGFTKNEDGSPALTDDAVREVLNRQVDEFIKAYKAANPKVATAPTVKAQ